MKCVQHGVFSGPYFPVFGLNTERYEIPKRFELLRIQSECGKIRTRKNFVFGHFSSSVDFADSREYGCSPNFSKFIILSVSDSVPDKGRDFVEDIL